ncbi:pectate lyase [Sphingomonas pituitosa]|uniref:pectate lyase n=1 Tax=Sphingomonas pituitosa TaxID=99597 RepID=UPI0008363748|nr:pectate lyase [Sphingomonas pituitosa]
MHVLKAALWVALAATPIVAGAREIGRMTPAAPITEARIGQLPPAEQPAWRAYLARSRALMAADKAALAAERAGGLHPPSPPTGPSGGAGMPLDRPAAWYAGLEARHTADTIVSFQTPAGGWGKNVDRAGPPRQRGQAYVPMEHLPSNAESDIQADPAWRYVGTIDNNATTSELRFLARVQAALPGREGDPYRDALAKGVRYLLAAQFPNGGWPQVFPLQGGYHDALTFNDDALADVVSLLTEVAAGRGEHAALAPALAVEARAAVDRAIAVILKTQVVIGGTRTIWGQQHDALTLQPAGARNFEPASLASYESARLLVLLMQHAGRSPQVQSAVRDGIAWLRAHALYGQEWTAAGAEGRRLVAKPGAGPIWSRYYDLRSMWPIFGDRDRRILDDVNAVSLERRNGYSWFSAQPQKALDRYARWQAASAGN